MNILCRLLLLGLTLLLPTLALAQPVPPSLQPLLQAQSFTYAGSSFVPLPNFGAGDAGFSYGGHVLAHNPADNTLYMGGHDHFQLIGKFPMPQFTIVPSTAQWQLMEPHRPTYSPGGIPRDPSAGRLQSSFGTTWKLGGLLIKGADLHATGYIYYDAEQVATVSHFRGSTTLTANDMQGGYRLQGLPGTVAGYMTEIPAEWQPLLGGNALTGLSSVPIICRASLGPSATVFTLEQVGQVTPVPSTTVLRYPCDHPTLGTWGQNPPTQWFSGSDLITGMSWIHGTRTIVYFGMHGATNCYGPGTNTQSLHGTPGPGGQLYCYDPGVPGVQNHGYPYTWRFWLYDANELVAVKNGAKQHWDVLPYAMVDFQIPVWDTGVTGKAPGGMAYDRANQRLIITQRRKVDDNAPLIHAYNVTIPLVDTTGGLAAPTNLRRVDAPPPEVCP